MSKKLNIIEAMKMPVGTELKFVYENGLVDSSNVVIRELNGYKTLIWSDSNSLVVIKDCMTEGKFIPIQQPVSFMEVVKSKRKVKALCEGYNDTNEYKWIHEVLQMIIENNPCKEDKALNDFISKGKWYIEESEEE